jgi:hypothetical protein
MLYKVQPKSPLSMENPAFLSIETPPQLALLSYGFNSFKLSLQHLHKEGFHEDYQEAFNILGCTTDIDTMICPWEHALKHLHEHGAMPYFHAIEKNLKGKHAEVTPPIATRGSRAPLFLQFKHEGCDYSLESLPLEVHLLSSTQAFYDLRNQVFVFKNEACYAHYCRREIYTPTLGQLLQRSKRNGHTRGTVVFLLKNQLKMRCIGWTLSKQDRQILEEMLVDEDFADALNLINEGLKAELSEKHYIKDLLSELGRTEINLQLLLVQRPNETIEKFINYALYPRSTSVDEIIRDLASLTEKVTLSEEKLIEETQDLCNKLLSDLKRQDEDKWHFLENIDQALLKKINLPKEWTRKKHNNLPAPSIEVIKTQPITRIYNEFEFQGEQKLFDLESRIKKEAQQIEAIYNALFKIDLNNTSKAGTIIHMNTVKDLENAFAQSPWIYLSYFTTIITVTPMYFLYFPKNGESLFFFQVIAFFFSTLLLFMTSALFYYIFAQNNVELYAAIAAGHTLKALEAENDSSLIPPLAIHALHLLGNTNQGQFQIDIPVIQSLQKELQWFLKQAGLVGNPFPSKVLQFLAYFVIAQRHSHIKDLWHAPLQILLADHTPNPEAQFDALLQALEAEKPINKLKTILNSFVQDLLIVAEPRRLDYYQDLLPSLIHFIRKTEPVSRTDLGAHVKLLYMPLSLFLNDKNSAKSLAQDLNALSKGVLASQIRSLVAYDPRQLLPNPSPVNLLKPLSSKYNNLFIIDFFATHSASTELWTEYNWKKYCLFVFLLPMLTLSLMAGLVKLSDPDQIEIDLSNLGALCLLAMTVVHFFVKEDHRVKHLKKYDELVVKNSSMLLLSAYDKISSTPGIHPYALYTLCTMVRRPFNEARMLVAFSLKTVQLRPKNEHIFRNIAFFHRFLSHCADLKLHQHCEPLILSFLSMIATRHHVSLEQVWFLDLAELSAESNLKPHLESLLSTSAATVLDQLSKNKPVTQELTLALNNYASAYARLMIEKHEIKPTELALDSLEKFICQEVKAAKASNNPGRLYQLYTEAFSLYSQSQENRQSLVWDFSFARPKHSVV